MRSTVLFVPGLRDYVADHWQTLLAAEIAGSRTVAPLEHDKLSRAARVMAVDRALRTIDGPVLLAAHSAGCLMVAHWAQCHDRPISGALLATPPDIGRPLPAGYPTPEDLEAGGWLPTPRARLPFPAVIVGSDNDPLASAQSTAELARAWGCRFVNAGAVGHLNPAAGYGHWPIAKYLIAELDAGDAV
ncbi:MAG: RBBP9/YdeN family alpha/beta hydrolase [Caulobacteraceae bacterium]